MATGPGRTAPPM